MVVGGADGLVVMGDELGGVVVEVGGVVKTELGAVGSASWSGDRPCRTQPRTRDSESRGLRRRFRAA